MIIVFSFMQLFLLEYAVLVSNESFVSFYIISSDPH